MEIKWVNDTAKYANGRYGYVGHWKLFYLYWDSGSPPKNDEGKKLYYRLTCNLPGLKEVQGNYLKEDEGKERASLIFQHWMKKLQGS